jgi:hypothetical protein
LFLPQLIDPRKNPTCRILKVIISFLNFGFTALMLAPDLLVVIYSVGPHAEQLCSQKNVYVSVKEFFYSKLNSNFVSTVRHNGDWEGQGANK